MFPNENDAVEIMKLFQQTLRECGIKSMTINPNGWHWEQEVSHDTRGFGFWRKLAEKIRKYGTTKV